MKIAFRVDASPQIGTGHFMRCLTLADELKRRGAQVRFVSRSLPGHLLQMVGDGEHGFSPLAGLKPEEGDGGLPHAHWLGTSQARDASETIDALSGVSWDWLIADHYALDARWESLLRKSVGRIAVIDDIADRTHDCDLLLDQNFHPGGGLRYAGKVPESCTVLSGPKYALLRAEFRAARRHARPRLGAVERILIFFGGVDAGNLTGQAIEAVAGLGMSGLRVDVVVGASHPRGQEIAAECFRHGFVNHVQTGRMAELAAAADLAIGAGGIAVWERCCLGLPTLTLGTAQNQKDQIAAAACAGLLYAPEPDGELVSFIRRHVAALIENPFLRQAMSRAAFGAVDGGGVWRMASGLGFNDVEVRTAGIEDSPNLFAWRNDASVRAVSRSGDLIDWDTHQRWLASVLDSADRYLLVGECDGSPVGVVRFDVRGEEAEISIYLVPGAEQPPGRGRSLLQSGENWLVENRPEVARIRAVVLAGNERSARLFSGAGYTIESTDYSKRLGRQ